MIITKQRRIGWRPTRAATGLAALAIVLSDCSWGGYGFPAAAVPARPVASDFPDAGYVVLDDVATLEFRPAESSDDEPTRKIVAVLDHRRRIKILTRAGLAAADLDLPLDGFSTITRAIARSMAPNGKVSTMKLEAFQVAPREDAGVASSSAQLQVLRARIPGARVGGLLEYRYTKVFVDPNLVPPWVFADRVPVLRSELGLVVAPGLKVDYRYFRDGRVTEVTPMRRSMPDGRERMLFVERDLRALYPEPLMPHPGRVAPTVAVVLTGARMGEHQYRLETWDDVARHVKRLTERVGAESRAGRPQATYRQIRDALNGLPYWGLGILSPASAQDLLKGSPACTRDAAALLQTALSGGGSGASLALITSSAGPPWTRGFPSLYPFVRAVVAVDVSQEAGSDPSCAGPPLRRGPLCAAGAAGGLAFLDPLCKQCAFGQLPTDLTGESALLVSDAGARWVAVPPDRPESNRWVSTFRMRLEVDGMISGELKGEVAGARARRLRQATAGRNDAREHAQVLHQHLFGVAEELQISAVELGSHTLADRPLSVRAQVGWRADELGEERFRVRPAALFGPALPGPWRRTRRFPAILEGPAWVETTGVIRLPVGYRVDVPPVSRLVTPFAEYAAGFAQRDRRLHYSRRFVLKQHVVGPRQWEEFYSLVQQIQDIEQAGASVGATEE